MLMTCRLVFAFKVRLQVRSRGLRLPIEQVLVQASHSRELSPFPANSTNPPFNSQAAYLTPPIITKTSSSKPRSLLPRHPTINDLRVRCLQRTVDDTKDDERPVCILRFPGVTDAMLAIQLFNTH